MKNDPIEGALARLEGVDAHSAEGRQELRKALQSKYSLVAGKAARLIGDALAPELAEPLASAFARFLPEPDLPRPELPKPELDKGWPDKGCVAKTAIARALVQLDLDDADLFRRGMKHVQREGTWGGSTDVAAEFRAVCAMGLANSRDPKKLRAMVELLADKEWQARAGAVKAIAVVGSEAAGLLLRYKALLGDPEPDVISECLAGLLSAEGAEALPLVTQMAESGDRDVSDAAIAALGASRREDAVEWLQARFAQVADADSKKAIVLALASARTEKARDFLLEAIRTGSAFVANTAISAMGMSDAVRSAMECREDACREDACREDAGVLPRQQTRS
jgi:HEAT repeat protein